MYHGIINIYKEAGYTSHDVVAKLRGILKQKKIGHTGTLDPAAEGVLPVCLGMGTRLCDLLTEKTKSYRAVMLLGVETDTQDITGKILNERSAEGITEEDVRRTAMDFIGPYSQVPPMYSALKVGGKKLCDLARAGIVVERSARQVEILGLDIEEIKLPRVTMTVSCSKGTYIRTLCHDIGARLGCGACMESLLRTRSGAFLIEDSLRLGEVERLCEEGTLEEKILPVEALFQDCPGIRSKTPLLDRLLNNGNPFTEEQAEAADFTERTASGEEGTWSRLFDSSGRFIGVYEYRLPEKKWQPKKIFLGGD